MPFLLTTVTFYVLWRVCRRIRISIIESDPNYWLARDDNIGKPPKTLPVNMPIGYEHFREVRIWH